MVSRTFCDRCGSEFTLPDEHLFQNDDRYYWGKDICRNCSLDVEIIKTAAQDAAIAGTSISQALLKWKQAYDNYTTEENQ